MPHDKYDGAAQRLFNTLGELGFEMPAVEDKPEAEKERWREAVASILREYFEEHE